MKRLEIITGENSPILRTVCKEVKKFDNRLKKLSKQMKTTMQKAHGIGIAAPQVGIDLRMFIVTLSYEGGVETVMTMINPNILEFSKETNIEEEGCLSLPGVFGNVERSSAITVEFLDLEGSKHFLELQGLNARVVQHENDHINGVLFIDKLY